MTDAVPMSPRANALFNEHCQRINRQTDRVFAGLMVVQFVAGIIFALVISPRTWAGTTSSVHPHLIAALVLGGAIAILPICLVTLQPGRLFTRLVVAIAQMSTSALLIHLTGGRIETHFHVFGSLAFLAFYRDWRVFVPATIVIALDHLLRGLFWPESVYGVLNAPIWRSLEHAGWVAFEDVFLILACVRATREMKDIARTRAQLEETNALIESKVVERTAELAAQHKTLQETHVQLMHASRRAGMAEIASGVLHNVGNVLNSVNVSASLATDRVRKLKLESLSKAAAMIRAHDADLGRFVTEDEKGRLIPSFLEKVSQNLLSDQNSIIQELAGLSQSIEHIKAIVSTQQTYARSAGLIERLNVRDIVEDALRMHTASFARHGIRIIREFNEVPSIEADKHQLLQILLNLLSNARHAMHEQTDRAKLLTLRIAGVDDACVQVEIADTGVGIAPENLQRIFAHGFTTKTDGHGFGLHASANAARQMGGTLKALSDGMNRGATFILEFPISKTEAVV